MKLRARAIRTRLTLTYGVVFLLTGAVLLTVGYLLVRHNLHARRDLHADARKLAFEQLYPHFHPPPGGARSGDNAALGAALAAGYAQAAAATLHRLLIEYVGALAAMTGVSVVAGWIMAGRALTPLDRAFESQRQFVANASHELRTPLAIMRTEVDVTLADPDAGVDDLRAMGETVRETIDRSEGLIAALLTLARSEMVSARQDPIDLALLAGGCVSACRPAAEAAGLEIEAELAPAPVRGDRPLLERLLANLLDNGIRHNVAGGSLRVTTRTVGGEAELVVSNGGSVIDPEQVRTLTEPFRRLTRTPGGYGVGLSIVRSVAEAHRGSLQVTAPASGGLEVRVRLPGDSGSGHAPDQSPPRAAGRRSQRAPGPRSFTET
jgi:signal transduction histidine kinase